MHKIEYPWLLEFLKLNIPFSVISAGTDLPVNRNRNIFTGFSKNTLSMLSDISKQATIFTTRGYLSQQFCVENKINNVIFTGDIAFYDKRFGALKFEKGVEIRNIIISDPHYANLYIKNLGDLYFGIRKIFSGANISVALHGVNNEVVEFCQLNNIPYFSIYEDRNSGLDIYNNIDLHIGFRVHAHVSVLKRRKYSYLLEQDGRGCDYGVTLERKISVPNYRTAIDYKNLYKVLGLKKRYLRLAPSTTPVQQLLSMVASDAKEGFEKFLAFENQVQSFAVNTEKAIIHALNT